MTARKRIAVAVVAALAIAAGVAWHEGLLDRLGLGGNEQRGLTLYGNVDIRQVDLGFRVPGRLAEMRLEEGDTAKAGEVIAVLDKQPFQDALARAKAGVAAARAALAKLEAGSRPEEIAQARANVAEQRATLLNAKRVLERRKKLIATGAVSSQSYDDARAAYNEAQARLNATRATLALVLKGPREEDIEAGRAQLAEARAIAASSATDLADTELRAPADGIVLSRVREPGAVLAAGSTVYTLSLTRPIWVQVYVPEPDLGRIHGGMAVEITTDSQPHHPYKGQIGFISPVAEFTPKSVETPELRSDLVYRVRIVVEAPAPGLLQGMPVTVHVPEAATRGNGK